MVLLHGFGGARIGEQGHFGSGNGGWEDKLPDLGMGY